MPIIGRLSTSAALAAAGLLIAATAHAGEARGPMSGPAIQLVPQAGGGPDAPEPISSPSQIGVVAVDQPEPPGGASEPTADDDRSFIMGIQRGLSLRGYDPGPVDGVLGPQTVGAISAYQEDEALEVTGAPTPQLYDRLLAESHLPPQPEAAAEPAIADLASSPASSPARAAIATPASAEEPAAPDLWQRKQDVKNYSGLELAIVSFFDFMRDSTLFIVDSLDGDDGEVKPLPPAAAPTEVATNAAPEAAD